ncbi:hypothetical protein [Streptomyces sp. NPDC003077]|uniref:hypothetical protein n=1 Tax=Streptomyces sp. NPDC003077 TaxID=3154443 RepID=UPI0033BBC10D
MPHRGTLQRDPARPTVLAHPARPTNPFHPAGLLLLLLVLIGATAGCGIGGTGLIRAGGPASGIQEPGARAHSARLYLVGPYGVRAVSRPVDRALTPQQALDLLMEGPTETERERGLISEVPPMRGQLVATAGTGRVDVYVPMRISEIEVVAVSQLACTAAHADVPGGRPPTAVDIRFHENGVGPGTPWTVRCNASGNVSPAR